MKIFVFIIMIMSCTLCYGGDSWIDGQEDQGSIRITDGSDEVSINTSGQMSVTPYHDDGTEGVLVSGINYVSGKSGIDASTETLQVIEYEHHEIHSGSHFFIEDVVDLAINNVFDMQYITPDTTKWVHFVLKLSCESETEWYIYENPVINVTGTPIYKIANNRNIATTTTVTVYGITNADTTDANADTAVASATTIAHGIIGAGKDGGTVDRNHEIILKQNTPYCFRAIVNTAGYISFDANWYEHTDKN